MDSIFYWLSKLVWMVISPDSLLVLLIIICWGSLWLGINQLAKRLLGLLAIVTTLIALFPVGEWVVYPLEKHFPPNPDLSVQVDGLILLGGAGSQRKASQWRQPELNESGDRYLAFMALARQYPEAQLVFTGGAGGMLGQKFSEADMARQLFSDHGIDHERVLFEGKSRNTYENATLTKQLVDPAPGEHWLLVTSAWHMPRSVGVFCKADWPVIPYPVDHISNPDYLLRVDLGFAEHLWNLAFGLKEWVGLVAYYLTGKTTAFFPAGCRL